jgi:hypothetical protein
MYSGLQNGFFENILIAEFFNCHNDIHSNLHSQISSVVVFNDHDGTLLLYNILIFFNNYQRTFPWEFSKIPKFNLAENFPKTTHQDKE